MWSVVGGTASQSVWLNIDCKGGVLCNKNGKVGRA